MRFIYAHGDTNHAEVAREIVNGQPFTGSAMSGKPGQPSEYDYGRLNATEKARFAADRPRMTYVIYSYATPVAWRVEGGEWYTVSQSFSMTTSHHMGHVHTLIRYAK